MHISAIKIQAVVYLLITSENSEVSITLDMEQVNSLIQFLSDDKELDERDFTINSHVCEPKILISTDGDSDECWLEVRSNYYQHEIIIKKNQLLEALSIH